MERLDCTLEGVVTSPVSDGRVSHSPPTVPVSSPFSSSANHSMLLTVSPLRLSVTALSSTTVPSSSVGAKFSKSPVRLMSIRCGVSVGPPNTKRFWWKVTAPGNPVVVDHTPKRQSAVAVVADASGPSIVAVTWVVSVKAVMVKKV